MGYQTRDLLEAMHADVPGESDAVLRVDGGMTASDWTMQFLADILGAQVDRPQVLETTALDVHFLLHLPESLRMNVFYGEESSTVKEDVQAIHYFANTSQLFLSDLMARGGALRPQDDVMLRVEYEERER